MSLSYNTSIPVAPFATRPGGAMSAPSAIPGPGKDLYAALSQQNAVDYDRAAQMQDATYMQRARDVQNQMALRGLEQMAQGQGNALSLQQQRMGYLNSLLSGLFN